jgi:hypothetical protein
LESVRFAGDTSLLRSLSSIDRKVLGFSRSRHHEYFLRRKDGEGYLFRDGKGVLGYAYVWQDGQVGPVAASSDRAFAEILENALCLAASKNPGQVSILVPGSNTSAVTIALRNKLRVGEPYVLMATEAFGKWTRYLCHSPPLL